MIRIVSVLVVLLLLLGGAGILLLGAFPPAARTEQVQKVLPNDRFAPR